MSSTAARLQRDRYVDSVALMAATRAMRESDGVEFAAAVMGTPANIATLQEAGIEHDAIREATPNDVVLAVSAEDESLAANAIEQGTVALAPAGSTAAGPVQRQLRSLEAAIEAIDDANVAIVSVPGPYAALEAHKALAGGLDVLLFSDNVSVEDEIALKEHAVQAGRLMMGPGAGTARLGGCGLGFANVVATGRVGVVAAAGTGAQEAMVLLDRWGEGVSHVIGVGGRDLSEVVAGRGARHAVQALEHDQATDVVLLVSKPPSPDVAAAVLSAGGTKPIVAALVGREPATPIEGAVTVSSTIEGGVRHVVELLGGRPPSYWSGWRGEVARSLEGLGQARTAARGLFSGGTLCYETLTLWQPLLGPVWSNTPLDPAFRVPAPDGAHICLDLGEEEYTKGRPHPMIDAEARLELLAAAGAHDHVATVLLDVVLGDGAHADPASVLAPACAAITRPDGPRLVVYVLGTDRDPQGLDRQRQAFRQAGCLVAPTGARAALAAAAIALRRPDVVEAHLL